MYLEHLLSYKNSKVSHFIGLVWVLFIQILGSSIYLMFLEMEIYDSTVYNLLEFSSMMLSFVVAFLGLWWYIFLVHKIPLARFLTSRQRFDWNRFWFSFSLMSVLVVLVSFTSYIKSPEDFEFTFDLNLFLIQTLLSIVLISIQSLYEEMFFRGYLMKALANWFNRKWIAFLLPALLFGFAHALNPEVIKLGFGFVWYYVFSGLFFGIIVLMDGGLELTIGYHIANNLISSMIVTSDWAAIRSYAILRNIKPLSIDADMFLVLALEILILYVFYKKYKWTDWKNKLLIGKINES